MKAFALVLSLALLAKAEDPFITIKDLVAVSPYRGTRIIAGEPADPEQFPWQVAVYYRRPEGGLFFCGGSLINDRFVLTAAHCAAEASEFSLFFGGHRLNSNEEGTLTIDVPGEAAEVHPFYNPVNLNNDIALIRLPEPIPISERISPIRLPQPGEILQVGSELSVSGWGLTESSASIVNDLLFTFVHSISNLQCAAVYGTSVVIDSTVCTQGSPVESPCNGDSGGPLVSYDGPEPTLVGVVSFIHRDGCTSGQPAGYVRVEAQLDFINQVISEPELPPPENPEEPPPEEPEDPEFPPPEDPEQPPENPEEPPPPPEDPEDPEQPPPQDPEEPPVVDPEDPELPPPEDPEEPELPPPEDPEQPPPEDPEDPELPPPEDPEQPPPEDPEDPEFPPPEDPEEPPPENPEDPEQPPPEDPEEPPSEDPESPEPEDPIIRMLKLKAI